MSDIINTTTLKLVKAPRWKRYRATQKGKTKYNAYHKEYQKLRREKIKAEKAAAIRIIAPD